MEAFTPTEREIFSYSSERLFNIIVCYNIDYHIYHVRDLYIKHLDSMKTYIEIIIWF